MTAIDLRARTLAGALWTPSSLSPLPRGALLAVVGSLFVALCAQITVPLWPVPVTGQTFAVLSVGLVCGWRIGGAALLLYLIEGALGLPFFAGGKSGWAVVVGASGGYIWGFILAAALVGWLAERGWDRNVWRTAVALFCGNVVLYVPGLLWLGQVVGWDKPVLEWGLTPFLFGDFLKLALAAALIPAVWAVLRRRG